jgi:hypothetical protein
MIICKIESFLIRVRYSKFYLGGDQKGILDAGCWILDVWVWDLSLSFEFPLRVILGTELRLKLRNISIPNNNYGQNILIS